MREGVWRGRENVPAESAVRSEAASLPAKYIEPIVLSLCLLKGVCLKPGKRSLALKRYVFFFGREGGRDGKGRGGEGRWGGRKAACLPTTSPMRF